MATTNEAISKPVAARNVASRAGRAIGAAASIAVAANLAIYGIARVFDADLLVPESPGSEVLTRLEPVLVVVLSIMPVALAAIVAVALGRWAPARGGQIFTALVAVGLVGSFAPIVTGGLSAGTVVALSLMHLVVGATALVFLPPLAGRGRA